MAEVDREIGQHGARLNSLEDDMTELKKDVKSILEQLSQARGGWKTLMLVAGIAGAVGAILGKMTGFFRISP